MGLLALAATRSTPNCSQREVPIEGAGAMTSVGDMIDNARLPSPLKRFVNRRMVPAAIDAAGAVESAVYELSEHVRDEPKASLLAAGALGFVAGALMFRRSRG
jgi:ElaB/YqjD/DUF883 family membrane-anchored ribosome-binding protein